MPQNLSAKEVAQAALTAHTEGRLAYQRNERRCRYTYKNIDGSDTCCAIGAALTEDTIEQLIQKVLNGVSIIYIARQGIISFKSRGDSVQIKRIQLSHDRLVAGNPDEEPFLDLLKSTIAHKGDYKIPQHTANQLDCEPSKVD